MHSVTTLQTVSPSPPDTCNNQSKKCRCEYREGEGWGEARLKGGDYTAGSGGVWTQDQDLYSVQNISYDKNGNILTLDRFGLTNGAAHGIDQLAYTYVKGNQLDQVDDGMDDDLGFKEKVKAAGEYGYDKNGNMTRDDNKGIATIEYNYLNLPKKVTKDDGQYIKYLYDAAGIKLAQEVYDATDNLIKRTDYSGEYVYENDTLQFVQHEEGRIVVNREYNYYTGEDDISNVYQYHLKDHLGNVRMTIQEPETEIYIATIEDGDLLATKAREMNEFGNIIETENSNLPVLNHTAVALPEIPDPKFTALLNGWDDIIGPSKMLHVIPGDEVQAETFVKYLDLTTYGSSVPAGAIANALGTTFAQTAGESATVLASLFSDAFTLAGAYGGTETNRPRAFLNYLLFDKDHNFIDMGAQRLGTTGMFTIGNPSLGVHEQLSFTSPIDITKEGYLYIYVSNETELSEVYFDDIKITHIKSPIVQKDDYYPFGLTLHGAGYKRQGETENKFLYNGKEQQDELDLGWMDYGARMYDAAIGRLSSLDPLADLMSSSSVYIYSFNNPIRFIDPDGKMPVDITKINKSSGEQDIASTFVDRFGKIIHVIDDDNDTNIYLVHNTGTWKKGSKDGLAIVGRTPAPGTLKNAVGRDLYDLGIRAFMMAENARLGGDWVLGVDIIEFRIMIGIGQYMRSRDRLLSILENERRSHLNDLELVVEWIRLGDLQLAERFYAKWTVTNNFGNLSAKFGITYATSRYGGPAGIGEGLTDLADQFKEDMQILINEHYDKKIEKAEKDFKILKAGIKE